MKKILAACSLVWAIASVVVWKVSAGGHLGQTHLVTPALMAILSFVFILAFAILLFIEKRSRSFYAASLFLSTIALVVNTVFTLEILGVS